MKVNLSLLALILTAIFVTLKLNHAIDWSWWIVFLPLLIWAGLVAVILIVVLLALILAVKYGD